MSGQGTLGAELLEDVRISHACSCRWAAAGSRRESGSRCAARASRSSACRLPPAAYATRWRVARRHARPARRRSWTGSRSSAPASSRCRCCESFSMTCRPWARTRLPTSMVFLAENAKLVVEGAGAWAALLLGGRLPAAGHHGRGRVRRQCRQRTARGLLRRAKPRGPAGADLVACRTSPAGWRSCSAGSRTPARTS